MANRVDNRLIDNNLKTTTTMAKQPTVSFKLAVDEMRGKLATKQTNIRYAGQRRGQKVSDLPLGKHEATNFEEYIVLTKRRGKQMFYVKSRTTVNNSRVSLAVRATTALASPLVDFIYELYQGGGAVIFSQLEASYVKWGGDMTIREYITSLVVNAMNAGGAGEEISFVDADGTTSRVLCANPYFEYNTPAANCYITIGSAPIAYTEYLPIRTRFRTAMQNYFGKLIKSDSSAPITIQVMDTTGRKSRNITLQTVSGGTYGATLKNTTQGASLSASFNDNMGAGPEQLDYLIIYKEDGSVLMQGLPKKVEKNSGTATTILATDAITTNYYIRIEE